MILTRRRVRGKLSKDRSMFDKLNSVQNQKKAGVVEKLSAT